MDDFRAPGRHISTSWGPNRFKGSLLVVSMAGLSVEGLLSSCFTRPPPGPPVNKTHPIVTHVVGEEWWSSGQCMLVDRPSRVRISARGLPTMGSKLRGDRSHCNTVQNTNTGNVLNPGPRSAVLNKNITTHVKVWHLDQDVHYDNVQTFIKYYF